MFYATLSAKVIEASRITYRLLYLLSNRFIRSFLKAIFQKKAK